MIDINILIDKCPVQDLDIRGQLEVISNQQLTESEQKIAVVNAFLNKYGEGRPAKGHWYRSVQNIVMGIVDDSPEDYNSGG